MNRALLFLLSRSLKNRIILRITMLRRPGYFISVLAGAAYIYVLFIHHILFGQPRIFQPFHDHHEIISSLLETVFALLLFMAIAFNGVFLRTQAPFFNTAEVHVLFPAPVSRSSLVHYRLLKAQTGILLGTILSGILLLRFQLVGNAGFLMITLWLLYFLMFLYRTVTSASISGKRCQSGLLGVFLIAVISTFVHASRFASTQNRASLSDMIELLLEPGPLSFLLYPFRLLVRPVFAVDLPDFMVRVLPLLLVIVFFYIAVRRNESLFEKSNRESVSEKLPGVEGGRHRRKNGTVSRRSSRFALAPTGFPPLALYWKNMIMAGLMGDWRVLLSLPFFAVLLSGAAYFSGEVASMVVGSVAAALLFFLIFLGPIMFREDLRVDLEKADVLKTYPIPGWGIILGETLAPVTILVFLKIAMVLPAVSLSPAPEGMNWHAAERIAVGLGAVLLLPCMSYIGVLIQNATVLLLPGWLRLGRDHPQGVEAMGQRLIASIATMVVLLVAALPAAGIFLFIVSAGYWVLGVAVIPVAAAGAALILLVEAGIGVVWLGRLFEKFDPSRGY
jgi:ABC-2 type transport system permease protein